MAAHLFDSAYAYRLLRDAINKKGVTISPRGSIGAHLLFPDHAEESMSVLPLTASRCVSCGAGIAPVTVLVEAASLAISTMRGRRQLIAMPKYAFGFLCPLLTAIQPAAGARVSATS